MERPLIGVLALQGAFAKHLDVLEDLACNSRIVRRPDELKGCNGLIIPGGESTTMLHQLRFIEMEKPLKEFAREKPVFGTCAGAILMSETVSNSAICPFGLIEMEVERNGFGRQVESFQAELSIRGQKGCRGLFIRAPRIRKISPKVEVLADLDGEPVLVKQGHFLAATFHPELIGETEVHKIFLSDCLR